MKQKLDHRTVWISGATNDYWKLDPTDLALRNMPVNLVVVFDGRVNERNLIAAIDAELLRYPIFHAVVHENINDIWLQSDPRSNQRGIPIIIARNEIQFASLSLAERYNPAFVTQLLPESSTRGLSSSLLSLQITHFPDACAIGVVWNHVVSDLHGIYGFLNDIFARYCGTSSKIQPMFDRDLIWDAVGSAEPLSGSVSRTARGGIARISPIRARMAIPRYVAHALFDNVQLCINFDVRKKKLDATEENFSVNDFILANLLKIYHHVRPWDRQDVSLYFPINVRHLLGISGVVVANCIGNISMTFTREKIAELNVSSLAEAIRTTVSTYSLNQLTTDRLWAEHWRRRITPNDVYHHWLFGTSRLYSSSWVSRELVDARLGHANFLCLLRAPMLNNLPLPAFHSTVMPYRKNDVLKYIIRIGMRRNETKRLESILPSMPNFDRASYSSMFGLTGLLARLS